MKLSPTLQRIFVGAFFLGTCASLAHAQAAQPTAPVSTDDPLGEVVELSPFVVNTSRDVGFVASTSLAGGRLAGELKDTPAAYSVLTREFIDALDLPDLSAASEWAVNSTNITTDGSNEIFGSTSEISSRGVSASAAQRNFFPLNVNYDSYNLDRYDYSRGPNSILFGSGTFGGAANVVTKAPLTSKPFSTVKVSYGSWDNRRVTLDDNRPLTKDIAIRVNALWQDRQGWRDFDWEKKKAITLAALWKINPETQFSVEAEVGHIEKNNPPTYLNDQLSGWDGTTTFSAPVTTLPSNANALGVARDGSSTSPYFLFAPGLGMSEVENYANRAKSIGGRANGSTPVGGVLVPSTWASPNISSRPMLAALNEPASRFDLAIAGSHFRVPDSSFAISTNTPTVSQNYQTYSTFLRREFQRKLFFEAAANYSRELRHSQWFNVRGLGNATIDLNKNLPDGTPNPHFLDVYGDGTRSRTDIGADSLNARAALAYVLDRTPVGDFTFNVFGGTSNEESIQHIESLRVLRQADPRLWAFNDSVFYRYYWNDTNFDLPEIRSASYRDPSTGVVTKYPTAWIGDSQRPTDVSKVNTSLRYLQSAIKGKFFSERLHVLGAVRYDHLLVKRELNDNYGDYPANWNGSTVQYRPTAPADYLKLTYTPKDATGKVLGAPLPADTRPRDSLRNPLAQYANERFQDDFSPPDTDLAVTTYSTGAVLHMTKWLSFFGNFATSFNPTAGNLRLDGSLMPSPQSSGWDVGIRLFLLKNRVSVNLGRYEGKETAQPVEIPITSQFQTIAKANPIGVSSSDGLNSRGWPIVPRQAFDTRDRQNSGYELEVVANLSQGWRLSFNAALPQAYQTNAFADTRAFLKANNDIMRQILADTGVLISATGVATVDTSIPTDQRSPDATAAANDWNFIQDRAKNFESGKQKISRLTEFTGNVFTDYEFQTGMLKGLRLSAGANYRGKQVIGYRGADTIVDPTNPANAIDDPAADAYSLVYTDPYYTCTAGISYTMKLKNKNRLSLSLRVSNLFDEDQVLYYDTIQRPPGGDLSNPARVATPQKYAYLTPRSYSLSATLHF